MSVVDKLVNEWAFRCKKGYPDVNNPDDIKILKEIYSEYGVVLEEDISKQITKGATFNLGGNSWTVTKDSTDDNVEAINQKRETRKFAKKDFITAKVFPTNPPTKAKAKTQDQAKIKAKPETNIQPKATPVKAEYNKVIAHKLKTENVPPIQGTASDYTLTPEGKSIKITNEHDKEIFKKLYDVAPPKGMQAVGSAGSKGSGHGELALYWLLSQAGNDVQDTRGGTKADLVVNNIGVEIKSFSKEKDMIQLGRVGTYTTELLKLNTVFGINALLADFTGEGRKKLPPNAIHATGIDVVEACKHVLQVYELKEKLVGYELPFFTSMFNKLDILFANVEDTRDVNKLAATLLKNVLKAKFIDKPIGKGGTGGYMVNITAQGEIDYTYITPEAIDAIADDQIIRGVAINQGIINYSKTFFN